MPKYLKYKLDDGSELLVELPEESSGIVRAGNVGEKIEEAKQTFDQALDGVRLSALQLRKKFHDLEADEVEVKFGLKATGELGNFAVGKVGVEANYEVTLKWSKKDGRDVEMDDRIRQVRMRRMLRQLGRVKS